MAHQSPIRVPPPGAAGTTESQRSKGALAYVLSLLTGIIVFIIAENDRFVKFHALQSIVAGIVLIIISIVPCIGWTLAFLGWLYTLYGAYLVYIGKDFRIPYVAEFVDRNIVM